MIGVSLSGGVAAHLFPFGVSLGGVHVALTAFISIKSLDFTCGLDESGCSVGFGCYGNCHK